MYPAPSPRRRKEWACGRWVEVGVFFVYLFVTVPNSFLGWWLGYLCMKGVVVVDDDDGKTSGNGKIL